jgi:hypothetical protein
LKNRNSWQKKEVNNNGMTRGPNGEGTKVAGRKLKNFKSGHQHGAEIARSFPLTYPAMNRVTVMAETMRTAIVLRIVSAF